MDLMDALRTRRAIGEFTAEPVDARVIDDLIAAARRPRERRRRSFGAREARLHAMPRHDGATFPGLCIGLKRCTSLYYTLVRYT
jgi:hypothetical protein